MYHKPYDLFSRPAMETMKVNLGEINIYAINKYVKV